MGLPASRRTITAAGAEIGSCPLVPNRRPIIVIDKPAIKRSTARRPRSCSSNGRRESYDDVELSRDLADARFLDRGERDYDGCLLFDIADAA